MEYIHLNVKSGYSFFHSCLKIEDIVTYAKEHHLSAIALTDQRNMFGAMEFYYLCQKNAIQPILGMEVICQDETGIIYPLILLAQNNQGYITLCHLTNIVSKTTDVVLSSNDLIKYVDGIIAILPSYRSHLLAKETEKRDAFIHSLQAIYPNFYLGLEVLQDQNIVTFASKLNKIPCCIINEVKYKESSDSKMLDILSSIKDTITVNDLKEKNNHSNYFITDSDLTSPTLDQYWQNNMKIAHSIQYDFSLLKGTFVEYPLKDKGTKEDYLRALANKGLQKRLNNNVKPEYQKRLDYELDIITKTKYSDYFLVVYDYVRFAKMNQILVGPGRGSAAGSLVSYVLGITNVDPIKYNLLFERFLNPERITMPDIDLDFIDTRRDEVIRYIQQKYGENRSAHVIAFQTFAARQAIRDSAKALGLSLKEVDVLAKRIPNSYNLSLQQLYQNFSDFAHFIDSRKIYQDVFATALKVEGLPRQTTLHAAGIVVNNHPLHTIVPVYYAGEHLLTTQYDMNYLEQVGLLKMDILGLKNLAIIDDCLKRIKATYQEDIDLNTIDFGHPAIYRLLRSGLTTGVFQVESPGMKRAIQILKPNNFEDVVALLALFRPGPMEFIPTYARRKEGKEKIDYLDEVIKDILLPTYGIIIYQEQIIQILQKMANFSYGTADIVRRAISKKEESKLKEIEEKFMQGCAENQIEASVAHKVYELILRFANYGFNRAHSVSYAFITCQMAYLKAKYPLIFYTSLLSNFASSNASDTKMTEYIDEIKDAKIKLLPPSINHSHREFVVEGDAIRYALRSIKGFTNTALDLLIQERENGAYKDFADFIVRLVPKGLSKANLIPLIQAGALDDFGISRASLLASIDIYIQYSAIVATYKDNQLLVDYSFADKPTFVPTAINKSEEIAQEYEVLGFFLSAFPLELIREKLTDLGFSTIKDGIQGKRGHSYRFVLLIHSVRILKTKNGKYMAQLKAYDESGNIQVTVFPQLYESNQSLMKKNNFILVEGYIKDEATLTLIAEKIQAYEGEV